MIRVIASIFFAMLLTFPAASAVALSINMPDFITEGESALINLSIQSPSGFDGILYLSENNINFSVSPIPVTSADFTDGLFNYIWTAKGFLPGTFYITAKLTNL